MGLSSNTLLHQTSKLGLETILSEKSFRLYYCKEFLRSNYIDPEITFPMICFSDIPFSELHLHLNRYGDYTIGMNKNWARRKKLNPVLYFEEKATFTERLVEKFDYYLQKYCSEDDNEDFKKDFYFFLSLLSFAKNYEGKLVTDKVNYDNYRFSDEREWRYVPEVAEVGEEWFFKTYIDYNKNKTAYNEEISKYSLPFELTDINYIIVNEESEIDLIYNILIKKYSDELIRKNITRISINFFTNHQIKSDFL